MGEDYDYLFKCIVVGDGGVGKTALTLRFSKGFFTEDYKMTIGVDFHVKTISVDADEGLIRAKLQIWDTGGQERFSSIRPMYYRGALGALLIFDLTSISSFEHLPQWIEEVRANVQTDIPLLLVGNKNDLIDQRAITLEEINEFTRDFNLYYMETSAKTGDNVGDCFSVLACLMIGEGVPDKLIGDAIYAPGQIPVTPQQETLIPPEEAEQTEYEEPVSPDQVSPTEPEPETFTPEPTPEYAEPPAPAPEPEPESEPIYEPEPVSQSESIPETESVAPPEPEPQYKYSQEQNTHPKTSEPQSEPVQQRSKPSEPVFFEPEEQTVEPDIPVPEPEPRPGKSDQSSTDFEFKTPDQIMAEDQSRQQEAEELSSLPEMPTESATESYKPKSVPFSSGAPVPTERPDDFAAQPPKSPRTQQPEQSTPAPPQPSEKSDSLYNYMPEKPEPKEETKKGFGLFSRRKKKEKSEESEEEPRKPSLLESLSGRGPSNTSDSAEGRAAFVPFSKKEEKSSQPQETKKEQSNLRIIPNAENVEEKQNDFVEIPPASPASQSSGSNAPKMITCPKCGAKLSSEYAFCNKCGAKL